LFVPGGRHRLDVFAAAAERHKASALAIGEFPSMYLGMVGAFGFVWLMVTTLRAMLLMRRPGWGRFGVFCLWLMLMTIDGGGMQIIQVVTNQVLFRSNNRVSIFLLMFALLFLARLLTVLATRIPRLVSGALALGLVALGAFDQTPNLRIDPNFPHWENVAQREKIAEADQRLVAEVERRVPPGTAVYQLPAMQFPESGFIGRVPDYDQFRPYLFSKTLKFSYGNMKGRPEANWQNAVSAMSDEQRVAELKRQGFGAMYVLRNAYPPHQVEQLIQNMAALGHTEVIHSDYGDSFFIVLKT
jgi:phosphoglycerol transferase